MRDQLSVTKRLWVATVGLALFSCGCQGPSTSSSDTGPIKLKVGVVDTTRILPEMASYQNLRTDMMRDRTSFIDSLPPATKINKEILDKLQEESTRRASGWQKRTLEIVQDAVKQISAKAGEVAAQRSLDIVVVNTPGNRSVYYYAGQDITLDVMIGINR